MIVLSLFKTECFLLRETACHGRLLFSSLSLQMRPKKFQNKTLIRLLQYAIKWQTNKMIIVDELSLQIETVVAETQLLFNERALNRKTQAKDIASA